jgi:pantetheine-phosphate adenylyltransferase
MREIVAIYPGSFDPLTVGHLSIIGRAAALFARLVVVVGYNPNKKSLYALDERLSFVREAVNMLPNVEVDFFTGELLVDYARRTGASVVVRGLRNGADFRSEFLQSQMNGRMLPGLETVFLFSDADVLHVSGTMVREMIQANGRFQGFVPQSVGDPATAEMDAE